MANLFKVNQVALDTIIAIGAVITNFPLDRGDQIRWVVDGGVGGEEVILQDINGEVIYHASAVGANYTGEMIVPRAHRAGWYLPTIAAGVLYITKRGGSLR